MSFMNSLMYNPSGGVYGQPSQGGESDVLNLVRQIKQMNSNDFKDKANFMSDLSLKQDRLKRIYDTQDSSQGPQGQNTVMAADPNAMTGYQKGELGIRQQELGQNQQKINQTGKLGEEAATTKQAQEKLNQQKSDQINANKQADLERKIEESNQKIQLAQQALNDKTANQEAQLQSHKDLAAAVEERHKLEMANMQHRFDTTSDQHQQTIDEMQKRLDQNSRSSTTTEMNADGTKKTVTTKRGAAAKTVQVKGKDGKTYEIPADKVDDWNSNHAPNQDLGNSTSPYRLNPQD